jgi:hypothetical protein
MIKTYRFAANHNNVAGGGALGVNGWMRINSPQRLLRLLSLDFMFNSYAVATGEQDNPYNERKNYFNAELDATGLEYPCYDAFQSLVLGTRITSPTLFFNRPGRFDCDLTFKNEIWISVYTYNYDLLANLHFHYLQILAQVEETPIT